MSKKNRPGHFKILELLKIGSFKLLTPSILLEKGQTLIEAAVALSIALVLISSVVALVNATNRRANSNRQANQASKLAEEGMEIVRSIRDNDFGGAVRVGWKASGSCQVPPSYCIWSDLYTVNQTAASSMVVAYLETVGSQYRLVRTVPASAPERTLLGGVFTRYTVITDGMPSPAGPTPACTGTTGSNLTWQDSKQVSVYVILNGGSLRRVVTSCLTKWRQR